MYKHRMIEGDGEIWSPLWEKYNISLSNPDKFCYNPPLIGFAFLQNKMMLTRGVGYWRVYLEGNAYLELST